jgi:putative transcriptional regulator
MRENREVDHESLAGSLLLAHPSLRDGNFRRTVVLMTEHRSDRAMGVVLNRPLGKRLGELGGDFVLGPLTGVPLFQGGPVQTEQLIFAAWRINPHGFQLHWAIAPDKAAQFIGEEDTHVRAFLGYAGWSGGQLEDELKKRAWVVAQAPSDLFVQVADQSLWRNVLAREGAEWKLLADEPEDPEQN